MKCFTEYHLNTISKFEWEGNEGNEQVTYGVYYMELVCYQFSWLHATNEELKFYCVKMHQ